jgi:hypothetical protein
MTDGCNFLFFGDLEAPNCMDREPFFAFSLEDANADWAKVAKFLTKFSRDVFNAETLVTDAEDSRYRQAMIERLVGTLKNPSLDEEFLRWMSKDIYKGKFTANVLKRFGELAKESIEPAILRLMSSDFLEKLKERMNKLQEVESGILQENTSVAESTTTDYSVSTDDGKEKKAISTTDEEMQFFGLVADICAQSGVARDQILFRDTSYYFNVSHKRPTRWFVRLFSLKGDQKAIVTHVPLEVAKGLAAGFRVEEAPSVFGTSRVYFESVSQTWALKDLILASLKVLDAAPDSQVLSPE